MESDPKGCARLDGFHFAYEGNGDGAGRLALFFSTSGV